jgi:hypothetical protein
MAVAAPAPGDSATVLTRRGIAAGMGHYCVTGRPRSSERESGVKRNLGVWALAAHRGDCRASECKSGSRGTAYINKKTQMACNCEQQGKIKTIYCKE